MTDIIVSRTGSFSFWVFPSLKNLGIHFGVYDNLISISSWRICSAPSLSAGDNTVCSWGLAFLAAFLGSTHCNGNVDHTLDRWYFTSMNVVWSCPVRCWLWLQKGISTMVGFSFTFFSFFFRFKVSTFTDGVRDFVNFFSSTDWFSRTLSCELTHQ